MSYHFALLACQNDGAVGILEPGLVAGWQVVQPTIDILTHCHDVIKIIFCCHGELEFSLRWCLRELGEWEALLNLHLHTEKKK